MSNNHHDVNLANVASIIICSLFVVNITYAQSTQTNNNYPHPNSNTPNPTTSPLPENPPDLNRPPRAIHRTGTAIGARNSISIKSTDAGIIHRQPTASGGCINCGVIDFINKVSQGGSLNAIANGVVAGTVAREIARYVPSNNYHPIMPGGTQNHDGGYIAQPGNQYNIGVTMKDGSRTIITLPDAANFHQGDKVKLVDGMLVPDR